MTKLKELIDLMNELETGNSTYYEKYDAYLINEGVFKGIAIKLNEDIKVAEKFNNVDLQTANISMRGEDFYAILLSTKADEVNESFGILCLDFINEERRELVQTNPIEWFEEWKNLLGNVKENKMIYDYIGEMKTLLLLQKQGKNPTWESTNKGTYDITTKEGTYEVKTTIKKSQNMISIHNQFQLEYENLPTPLNLVFVRVEKSENGESIQSLYEELIEHGYDKNIMDEYLLNSGYSEGKRERNEKYIVHEVKKYCVNETFPRITKENFKNGEIPNGIVHIEYTVSLDGLEYESLI